MFGQHLVGQGYAADAGVGGLIYCAISSYGMTGPHRDRPWFDIVLQAILGVSEALAQARTVAREMVVEVEHKTLGIIPIVNRPTRYLGALKPAPEAPSVLGEHTDDIRARVLGSSAAEIDALRAGKCRGVHS